MKMPCVPASLRYSKRFILASAITAALSVNVSGATNVLTNPGFESGSFTSWTTYGNSIGNASVVSGASVAHSGTYYFKSYGQFIGATNYSGISQDNLSAPSNTYTADGWAYTDSSDGGGIHGQDTIWVEVSFRDASYNALALYRSAILTSNNLASFGGTNKWFDLPITNQCSFSNPSAQILLPGTVTNTVTNLVAPAGTVYVRYQTVFMQGPDNANASMYFDDLTLNQSGGTVVVPPVLQWNITWDDEFNQPDGSLPDLTKWGYDLGGGGWGNNELETYTATNARVQSGQLVIEADRAISAGKTNYTSARMLTKGKWSWTYGRMEARLKLPRGQGIWPAFWMLGTNIDSVHWPSCGEIDIMENIGKTSDQGTDHGTIHGPQGGGDYNGGSGVGGSYTLPGGAALADNFHIYAIEWTPNQIKWFLDANQFFTATPASLPGGGTWVFTQPQFFILNVAVGGNWPGYPDGTTVFPQQMLVDYVRVYQQTAPLALSVATQPDGSMTLSWPTNIVCHLQVQTNSVVGGNWSDVAGTTNPFVVTPDPNQGAVFYRLASP
ncbi:MAG TPA: family 16 glycosylhydrolase [Verrucomicrobiae bacterium]|nr:family 16 glycosylhydrolase [Verrucomicrobiae bacterium]